MKKKIFRILGVLVSLIFVVLLGAPFFLEAKIGDILKNNINDNIKGTFNFEQASLSLISSFPQAEVSLKRPYILTETPFEGDTLFSASEINLSMPIGGLFQGANEPIVINDLFVNQASLLLKINEDEVANYDIAKETDTSSGTEDSGKSFSFAMEEYSIVASEVTYEDLSSNIWFQLSEIEHTGSGDLSLTKSELQTATNAFISLTVDSTRYLNKNKVTLDALIGIDLQENTYSFLKNEALLNQLPLVFDGFLKVHEEHQEVQIGFKTPSSDFKNFLAVIPEAYSKNIEQVKTTGNFEVQGTFKGIIDDAHIPAFDISIRSDNASFKYPELPKTVKNIHLDALVKNETGLSEDTFIDIKKATFSIDKDVFQLASKITDLLGNTKVQAQLDGKMNLANIPKAYPMPEDLTLEGILTADVQTSFDMASLEAKAYENTQTLGQIALANFQYNSEEFKNPVQIDAAQMNFNPKTVTLNEMRGKTGNTDFNVTGSIHNLLGFVFNDEEVAGTFSLASDSFNLNDFMTRETQNEPGSTEGIQEENIQIPAFLNCSIATRAKEVLYDNLVLKNVQGDLLIKDQKATLSNMKSSLLDGTLAFNGAVSTKGDRPQFSMELGMEDFKIGETFKALSLFRTLAPIANALKGNLNSEVTISGALGPDASPDLKTITGNVLAEVLATNISAEHTKVLGALANKLEFVKPDKLNLKGLKTALSFENGQVRVKPFTITYEDIAIEVNGGHTFDQELQYTATLQVPAKYLGSEVNSLIAKIDEPSLKELSIPVSASIGGNYLSPQVKTDLTSGIRDLTAQLVEIQKQKLIDEGKNKAEDLLADVLGGNKESQDTLTQKDSSKVILKDVLGGVLGSQTTPKDSTRLDSTQRGSDPVEETAKTILGGLLGGKKKTEKEQKDTIN